MVSRQKSAVSRQDTGIIESCISNGWGASGSLPAAASTDKGGQAAHGTPRIIDYAGVHRCHRLLARDA